MTKEELKIWLVEEKMKSYYEGCSNTIDALETAFSCESAKGQTFTQQEILTIIQNGRKALKK